MLLHRTDFLCNKCGHWSAYYIKTAPFECHGCRSKLPHPNLQSLLDDVEERKKYHFNGQG